MTEAQERLGNNIIKGMFLFAVFLVLVIIGRQIAEYFVGNPSHQNELIELQKENLKLKNKILQIHINKKDSIQ